MEYVATHMAHETDYVTFALDEYRDAGGHQMLLAHLHIHKWTPAYLKRIRRDWEVFRKVVSMPLYATPKDYDAKWDRFVRLMGWRPFSKVLCHDGIERPLYIHKVD